MDKSNMKTEEKIIIDILKKTVEDNCESVYFIDRPSEVYKFAQKCGVSATIAYEMCNQEEHSPYYEQELDKSINMSYRMFYISRFVMEQLRNEGIEFFLLKGIDLASRYPIPELREFGDVDLFVRNDNDVERAINVLETAGFEKKTNQDSPHHITFRDRKGIEVELHTSMMRPFDTQRANMYISEVFSRRDYTPDTRELWGVEIPVLPGEYNAFYLLLHMLQHFLTAGFGLKLLADWCVFWNNVSVDFNVPQYLKWVDECGIRKFSDVVFTVCKEHLGLKEEVAVKIISQDYYESTISRSDAELFLEDVIASGRYGEADSNRLVNARNNSLWGLFLEFHHQMKMNHPKGAKFFLFWPFLWVATLVVFVYNNHKVRKTNTGKVIGKTLKRSKLTKQMQLWKR